MITNKLIVIPLEGNWDHSADFLRQTAIELAKNNKVVIYDQNNSNYFLKSDKNKINSNYHNIVFFRPKYYLPLRRFPIIEFLNKKLSFYLFLLKRRERKVIAWYFYPYFCDLASVRIKSLISIYDCVDYSDKKIAEEKLISRVDYFFVNSRALQRLHQHQSKKPIYLSSQGFLQPQNKKIRVRNNNHKRPVIGYIGGINYRFDFELVDKLISANKKYDFLFCGPIQADKEKDPLFHTERWIKKFQNYENAHFLMGMNREKLYEIINDFDIGIIPYNIKIPFNRYCYPMKLFEYFYFGKPVVSTPIEELTLPKFKDIVYIGKTAAGFSKIISRLANNDWPAWKKRRQQSLAIENSWFNKISEISKVIGS